MKNLELNKIAAAVCTAGIVALISANIADILYGKEKTPLKRGYQIEVVNTTDVNNQNTKVEEKIDINALLKTASAEEGAKVTKKCAMCHSFNSGGANKIGPNLWNIVNNKKAAKDNFNYSKALKAKGGVWNYEELYHFLHKPRKYLPGTKMAFAGLKKPQDIVNIIMYLRAQSNSPQPLPK